jgi:hypothetical protein
VSDFPQPPAGLGDPDERDDLLAPPAEGTYVGTTAVAGKAPGGLAKETEAIAYLTGQGLLFVRIGEPVWIPADALIDAQTAANAQVGVPLVVRWQWDGERYETGFLPDDNEVSIALVTAIRHLATEGEGSAR